MTFEIACSGSGRLHLGSLAVDDEIISPFYEVAWTSFGCCQWMVAYYNATSLSACPGNSGTRYSIYPDGADPG